MLKRVDIVGNPNLGVFTLATDDLAIVPYNLLDEKAIVPFVRKGKFDVLETEVPESDKKKIIDVILEFSLPFVST